METSSLQCYKCDATESHYEVKLCIECRDNAICCDCAAEIQQQLEVCSNDCAAAAIKRLQREINPLRRDLVEARHALARIAALNPATEPMPAFLGNPTIETRYSYTLGTAQGIALGVAPSARPQPTVGTR